MFNIFVGPVLKPKETHSLYTLLLAFYWLGGDFFIFIWEVRIRYWSRNLSQEFHRDVLLKRKPNRCIVAFDEAKSKSIVAFWWSEIPIDVLVSSHFDERNSNRSSYCDWAKSKLIYRRISRIRAKTSMPSLAIWKRRWVYRIPRWERRRVCRVLRLLSRAKMSISNLVIIESEDEYFESCE